MTKPCLDYGQAIQADQKYWEAYEHRALTEHKNGQYYGLYRGFSRKAVEINPTKSMILLLSFGGTCERLTNWDGAIDCYNRADRIGTEKCRFLFHEVNSRVREGRLGKRAFRYEQIPPTGLSSVTAKPIASSGKMEQIVHAYARRGWIKVRIGAISVLHHVGCPT